MSENQDAAKVYLFEQMPIPKAFVQLSVPTILSSLVMVFYNLADTFFVGMLNDSVQAAAVALAAPVLLAFNAVNNLFGVGGSSEMSRALGMKQYDSVRRSAAFSFYCSLAASLLFSLLTIVFAKQLLWLLGASQETMEATAGYLRWTVMLGAAPSILNVVMAYLVRAEGAAFHASVGTMSGCLLNIVLDPVFILPSGLNMGAAGAGAATFISNCVACLYFFILARVKRGKTYVCFDPRMARCGKRIVKEICFVGVPASIQNLLNVTGMTILNNFASVFGADAVAAMGIAQKVNNVAWQIGIGSSQGMMPLIGYNYASGNIARMKKTLFFVLKIACGIMTAIACIYFLFAPVIIRFFMDDPVIIDYGAQFMRGFCLSLPFLAVDFVGVGVYQACGLGQYSLFFAVLRKIILEIPLLFILNHLFPLYGLPYAQPVAELLLAAGAVILLTHLFRKWEARTAGM